MTEPTRIREDGPAAFKQVIHSAQEDEPSKELLAALALQLPAATAAGGAAASKGLFGIAKLWLVVGGVGLLVVAGLAVWPRGVDTARPTAVAPVLAARPTEPEPAAPPAVIVEPPAAPVAAPVAGSAPRAPLQRPTPKEQAAAPAPAIAIAAPAADELQGVDAAFAALREGKPERALELALAHERDFPHGAFAEERDVMAIEACVQLHRADEARKRAEQFSTVWPTSTHRRRVEALMAALDGE